MSEYREFTEEELKWIKSFQRVMQKAPSSLFLFCEDINVFIIAMDANNRPIMTERGAYDSEASRISIKTPMYHDGGGF